MAKWTVAMVIEFEAASQEECEAFIDGLCNESNSDFVWLDTITSESDKSLMPRLGSDD